MIESITSGEFCTEYPNYELDLLVDHDDMGVCMRWGRIIPATEQTPTRFEKAQIGWLPDTLSIVRTSDLAAANERVRELEAQVAELKAHSAEKFVEVNHGRHDLGA